MRYNTIIFDLDGTLVYTNFKHRDYLIRSILNELEKETPQEYNGMNYKEYVDKWWFEGNRNDLIINCFKTEPIKFWELYHKYDTAELRGNSTNAYKDTKIIKELKQKNYKLGILTGSRENVAKKEIEKVGEEYFDSIISAQSIYGINPKPHPNGLEESIKRLKTTKEKTIFIGNSDEDIGCAINAGVKYAIIEREEYTYPNINPEIKIKSLYELKDKFNI